MLDNLALTNLLKMESELVQKLMDVIASEPEVKIRELINDKGIYVSVESDYDFINIRKWYFNTDLQQLKPTKKGVCVTYQYLSTFFTNIRIYLQ